MNIETGEIKKFEEGEKIPKEFIEIQEDQMTKKQRATMQVSKYDSISKLGRLFAGNRKQRRRQAKEYRKNLPKWSL